MAITKNIFPFAGDGRAFYDGQPYLGGQIRILSNLAGTTNLTISHNLNIVPRFLIVLSATNVFTPKWKTAGTWTTQNILIQFDTSIPSNGSVTILIA